MSKQQRAQYNNNEENLKNVEKSARYFKAEFEKMYYALESEKLLPEFMALVQKKEQEELERIRNSYPKPVEPEVPATSGFSHVEGTELGEGELTTSSDADIKE